MGTVPRAVVQKNAERQLKLPAGAGWSAIWATIEHFKCCRAPPGAEVEAMIADELDGARPCF